MKQGRLQIFKRSPHGWTISGSLPGRNQASVRIRRRAKSNDYRRACEEAAFIEATWFATQFRGGIGDGGPHTMTKETEKLLMAFMHELLGQLDIIVDRKFRDTVVKLVNFDERLKRIEALLTQSRKV